MRRPLPLHIGHYVDILRTLHWDVLRTSYFNVQRTSVKDVLRTWAEDVTWHYTQNHIETFIGRLLGTPSGRNFAKWGGRDRKPNFVGGRGRNRNATFVACSA